MKKKKRRFSILGAALAALVLLVLVILGRLTLPRTHEVALAEPNDTQSSGDAQQETGQETIHRVEVTPQTVGLVIERLARPESYSRTITIERFWQDGSGKNEIAARVSHGWTRTDVAMDGDVQRHVVTGGGQSWIWYADGPVFSAAAALGADEEQSIPTYEDILRWSPSLIAAADYRELESLRCIYVETVPDEQGYVERDWVSVETGLLVAAERAKGEEVVYRMTALSCESGGVTAEAFTLPDGTVLFDPENEQGGG